MAKKGDAAKLKAQLGIQFTGIEAEIKKLAPFMAKLGKTMPLEIRKGLKQVNKDVILIGELLERATDPQTLEELKVAMSNVAREAQKVGDGMSRAAAHSGKTFQVAKIDRTTQSLKRMNVQLKQTAQQTMRTTLMSQNMLRVMQDSPFGMLGMANNIQQLGENLSHARNQGISFTKAMGAGLKNLLMGPMAFAMLITVATLIAQKWDVIVEVATVLKEKLEGVGEAQRDLNKRMREFTDIKGFEEMLKNLDAEELSQTISQVRGELNELRAELEGMADVRLGKPAISRGALPHIPQYKEGQREEIAAKKQLIKAIEFLEEEQRAAQAEQSKNSDKASRLRRWGIETERDKQGKRLTAKLQKEADRQDEDDHNKAFKQWEFLEQFRALKVQSAKIDEDADIERRIREKEEAENLAKELLTIAKQKYRDMAIAARRGASVISNTIRAGDIAASALGTGLLKKPKAGAGTEAQLAHRDAQLFLESAVIDEKISLRRQGMKDLEALMLDASDVALDNLKAKHAILAAQEQRFIDTIEEKARQAEEDKLEISRVGTRKQLQAMAGFTGEIGNLFGGMADVMSTEGEKGLEQNKSMLKAQAWAQAISASIGIFNNVANTPGLGPFAYAAAGAAMAATMVTLSAQIKKIDNPGGSSSTTISGGAFTALNANVTAERASNFQRSEDRRNSAGTQGAAASASNTEELLSNINEGIRTQKVVIDQATVADVERGGKTINTRRVQTSN